MNFPPMRTLTIILALIVSTSCYSQSDKFRAQIFIEDSLQVAGGLIIFPLTGDSITIDNSDTVAIIDLNDPKHWVFYFLWSGWASKIFRFDTNTTASDIQKINVPDTIFYKEFEEKHICPICLKSKYLIPIVYGMPLPKVFKLANKNKVRLGGCVYDFEKKYYCKRDDFEF